MNALALKTNRYSEADALRALGKLTWTAESEVTGLSAFKTAILNIPGITGFHFERTSESGQMPYSASALAPVIANGRHYGQVRIFFDPNAVELESPVRLARFVGQQIALLLHRFDLHRERQNHYAHLNSLDRRIRLRKLISRTTLILAEQRNCSQTEAVAFMFQFARHNRRSLLDICESLVFGYDTSRISSKPSKVSYFHAR